MKYYIKSNSRFCFSNITTILRSFCPAKFNKSHLDCLNAIVRGLIEERSVCLEKLAMSLPSSAQSGEQRIRRFLNLNVFKPQELCIRLLKSISPPDQPLTVLIDRTQWKLGFNPVRIDYNILQASVLVGHEALPVMAKVLDNKGGLVSASVLVEFLESLYQCFGNRRIIIIADREFPYLMPIRWLRIMQIPFIVRVKGNSNFIDTMHGGKEFTVMDVADKIGIGDSIELQQVMFRGRVAVNLNITKFVNRHQNKEILSVISSEVEKNQLEYYRYRWSIEHSFRFFKSSGMHVNHTHILSMQRFFNLWMIIMITVNLCWQIGRILDSIWPIKRKSHGRRQISTFRYGLNIIAASVKFGCNF